MMKLLKFAILTGFLFYTHQTKAQMIIGNPTNATTDKTSVLLDFERTNNRGLQLPIVTTLPSNAVDGTLLVDGTSAGGGRVKVKQNGQWVDLSKANGNVTAVTSSRTSNEAAHCYTNNTPDPTKCKVVLGAATSSADGVLVLESDTKAMVLPIVTHTDQIINPAPGMMAYLADSSTENYMLAVYNGVSWAFWAAQ